MEGIHMKTLKIISMLSLLFTVEAAFSQETVSTKKAASKPFFDSINPYVSISQRHTVFNESGTLSNITNLQTVYDVGVSVSKKSFARAVDRNSIKRQMRIALKEVKKDVWFCGFCMILYTGKKLPEKNDLIKQLIVLLKKVHD